MNTDVFRAYRVKQKDKGIDDPTINRHLSLLRRMIRLTVREKKLSFAVPYFPMVSEAGRVRKGFLQPDSLRNCGMRCPVTCNPTCSFCTRT